MSETPKDPLAFDFGIDFVSAAERVKNESVERTQYVARELPFGVPYLDDVLRSLLPHDLILIGAATGAGKTELARIIASANAELGKRVYYFALEAEPREIERRDKFATLCSLLGERGQLETLRRMNYPDWYRNRVLVPRDVEAAAEQAIASKRKTLFTYYRGAKFGPDEIKRLFLAIQSQADLIILDHLHYVDIEDENENRGFKTTIKLIRDLSIGIGRPVILIAHLRKTDARNKSLVPHINDFHGSSDISKVVTHAIQLAPAYDMPARRGHSPTYMYVPKDRHGGATGLVALCEFDRSARSYGLTYTLGRDRGGTFEPIDFDDRPSWASKHTPLSQSMEIPT